MSSTKFKVKQVKSGSETGLETFVELPIDQETMELHVSQIKPRDGLSTLFLSPDESVTIDLDYDNNNDTSTFKVRKDGSASPVDLLVVNNDGDLTATGDLSAVDLSLSGGLRSGYIGGAVGARDIINFSTETGNEGAFTNPANDADTFTINGPLAAGGKLFITSKHLHLNGYSPSGHLTLEAGDRVDLDSANGNYYFQNIPFNLDFNNNDNELRFLAVRSVDGKLYKDNFLTSSRIHSHFTGTHIYKSQEDLPTGSSVSLDAGTLALTTSASQANCVGIVQSKVQPTEETPITTSLGEVITSGNVYYVAAVGDSIKGDLQGFKVCNEGGEIVAGDLLVASSTPGRLMKQADDIIRASTVGKAMQSVTFNDQGQADDVYGFIYCG